MLMGKLQSEGRMVDIEERPWAGGGDEPCCTDGEVEFTGDSSIAGFLYPAATSPVWLLNT